VEVGLEFVQLGCMLSFGRGSRIPVACRHFSGHTHTHTHIYHKGKSALVVCSLVLYEVLEQGVSGSRVCTMLVQKSCCVPRL
jgi:hypothetical protein